MAFNFCVGKLLEKQDLQSGRAKQALLLFGICVNLGLLGYFKYSDFLIRNYNMVFNDHIALLELTLPLAISFFTFQQIIYLVDTYRGMIRDVDLVSYSLFVSFFPQLIAGPIVHHSETVPQFKDINKSTFNSENVSHGLLFLTIGLFKKVIIADQFAIWANAGFDNSHTLYFFEAWLTSLSYTFQLYFDFSGYADMAIGIALMFNIKLPLNFDSPYKSLDIQQFWRRWHMTLSRFLRDYVYIPLGGNRGSEKKVKINLMITFTLGGLWHGAGWTFILWGVLHGIALVLHRIWQKVPYKLNQYFAWFITFNFVNIAWVLFRASEFSEALKVLKGMFLMNGINLPAYFKTELSDFSFFKFTNFLAQINGNKSTFLWVLMGLIVVTILPNSNEIKERFEPNRKWLILLCTAFLVSIMSLNKPTEFLYFNF